MTGFDDFILLDAFVVIVNHKFAKEYSKVPSVSKKTHFSASEYHFLLFYSMFIILSIVF